MVSYLLASKLCLFATILFLFEFLSLEMISLSSITCSLKNTEAGRTLRAKSKQWKHDVRATANWSIHIISRAFIRFAISLLVCTTP